MRGEVFCLRPRHPYSQTPPIFLVSRGNFLSAPHRLEPRVRMDGWMVGWMCGTRSMERNVLTQLKRADKYEREEGSTGCDDGTRSLARGRARARDERFSLRSARRPGSVTDCPLENASCLQRDGNGSDPTPFPRHDGRRGTAAPRVQRLLLSCMSRMVRQIFVNSYRAGGRAAAPVFLRAR